MCEQQLHVSQPVLKEKALLERTHDRKEYIDSIDQQRDRYLSETRQNDNEYTHASRRIRDEQLATRAQEQHASQHLAQRRQAEEMEEQRSRAEVDADAKRLKDERAVADRQTHRGRVGLWVSARRQSGLWARFVAPLGPGSPLAA